MQPLSVTEHHHSLLSLAIKTTVNAQSQSDRPGVCPNFHTLRPLTKHIYRIHKKHSICLCDSIQDDLYDLYSIWIENQKKLRAITMETSLFCHLRPVFVCESLIAKLCVHKLIAADGRWAKDPLQIAICYLCQNQIEYSRSFMKSHPELESDAKRCLWICRRITQNISAMMALTDKSRAT